MAAVVHQRAPFVRDVNERIAWLAENAPRRWLDDFLAGLAEVRERIAEYPQAGTPIGREEGVVLRARNLPRPLPYVVYYIHDDEEPVTELFFVRLFRHGQNPPDFRVRDWP